MHDESLISANPDFLDGVDDLMQLSYLNEPSVLYNLQYRYNQTMIYVSLYIADFFPSSICFLIISHNSFMGISCTIQTKAGPVLVILKPTSVKELKGLVLFYFLTHYIKAIFCIFNLCTAIQSSYF
ncbi:hypothetical protein S245_043680 [Arachis hypogaea]